ncbi:hypothetical protein BDF21DRAFT_404588 [Thamnidium elegans]|nr:hypothetical protein BDF21DRAFT_404588 [Thamnidium elegans]
MNKLPISRQSFLDLFTDFVIANNLPMVFSSKNVTLERLLQFSNRSNADNEKTISYNSMLIPPSNTKLKELIIEKHKNQKRLVIEKLKQQKYINFTTDLWKSETKNMVSNTIYILELEVGSPINEDVFTSFLADTEEFSVESAPVAKHSRRKA